MILFIGFFIRSIDYVLPKHGSLGRISEDSSEMINSDLLVLHT